MSTKTATHASDAPIRSPRSLSGWGWFALWRSRRALKTLDDNRLEDVGISAREAAKEAARPIWDVPANWRR